MRLAPAAGPGGRSDAPLVARLRQLGAIPLGKTVTTEFAYFAPAPPAIRTTSRTRPAGSSSGSAAAVAAGVVPSRSAARPPVR